MKTSWVIAVEDRQAKDKAFKLIHKSRHDVGLKVADLAEKYAAIDADRFDVYVAAPNGETDPNNRLKLKFRKPENGGLKLLFAYLHEFNPFCYEQSEQFAWIEVDRIENYEQLFSHILCRS